MLELQSGPIKAALLLAGAASLGCVDPRGSGASRAPDPEVDTIDGVVHVWNPPQGAWTEGEAWSVEEVLRLGGLRGPEEELFGSAVLTTLTGPGGLLYVQDRQAERIAVFSAPGDFIRHVGAPGEGPGELSFPSALTVDGFGRLWVASLRRYTIFTPHGEPVRTEGRPIRAQVGGSQHPLYYLPDGAILDQAGGHPWVYFLKVDTGGAAVDTVGQIRQPDRPARRRIPVLPGSDLQTVSRSYLNRRRWTVAPDLTLWVVDTGELRLAQLGFDGDTIRVIHTSHRSPKLTSSEERMIDAALREVGLERGGIDFVRPVLQQILVMDDGHVLVQIEEVVGEDGRVFDIFDPEGRYLGPLDFGFAPSRLGVSTFRGDTILAPTLGRWDVPYVVKAVIHGPEAGPDG